ncbi:MAG: hypothetical protein HY254_24525 [Burkholderiales bacterium]|nr:hypothetical protein [Burkholderiales bacterium]
MRRGYISPAPQKRRRTSMCHCLESTASLTEPLHSCPLFLRDLVQASSEKYPAVFSTELLEAVEDQFTKTNENSFVRRNGNNFVCNECGTEWYLEWACEQTSWPSLVQNKSREPGEWIYATKADKARV